VFARHAQDADRALRRERRPRSSEKHQRADERRTIMGGGWARSANAKTLLLNPISRLTGGPMEAAPQKLEPRNADVRVFYAIVIVCSGDARFETLNRVNDEDGSKRERMSVDQVLQGMRDARKRLTDITSVKDNAEKVRIIDEVKTLNIAVTKHLEAIAANPDQVNKKQYKLLRREMFGFQLAFNAAMLAYLASYFSPT
jgi:hypothetical protein